MGIVGILSIGISSVVVLVFFAYCCKLWMSTKKDSFFTSANNLKNKHNDEDDANAS